MDVELLLVPDCPHGAAARALIETALADLGIHDATLHTTLIETTDAAVNRGFVGSPTFLIDGQDPFVQADDLPGLACRVYATAGGMRGLPELDDLRRALNGGRHPSESPKSAADP